MNYIGSTRLKQSLSFIFAASTLTMALTGCGGSDNDSEFSEPVKVKADDTPTIIIKPVNYNVKGTSDFVVISKLHQKFKAIAKYPSGKEEDVTDQVNWTSTSDSLGKVDKSGEITGVGGGDVELTATINGVQSPPFKLKVKDEVIDSIRVEPAKIDLFIGGVTKAPIAVAHFSDGLSKEITNEPDIKWTIADKGIASIKDGNIYGHQIGNSSLVASLLGSQSANVPVNVNALTPESIAITTENKRILFGYHADLLATMKPEQEGFANVDVTKTAIWSSSNPNVATVDKNGRVTASSTNEGDTIITAKVGKVTSNKIDLTITKPKLKSIQLTPTKVSVAKGLDLKVKLKAKAVLEDETTIDVTKDVKWVEKSGFDKKYLSISDDAIRGKKVGISRLYAELNYGKTKSLSNTPIDVQVTNAKVTGLLVKKTPIKLFVGEKYSLKATSVMSDDSKLDVTKQVNWVSKNDQIVSVYQGVVTGIQAGDFEVKVQYDGIKDKVSGTIVNLDKLTIQGDKDIVLLPNQEKKLEVKATYSDGQVRDVDNDSLSWESSNPEVVTVDKNGKIQISKLLFQANQQEAVITARANGQKSSVHVTVDMSTLVDQLRIVYPEAESYPLWKFQHIHLSAIAFLSNQSEKDVTNNVSWSVEPQKYATISDDGILYPNRKTDNKTVTVTAKLKGKNSKKAKIKIKIVNRCLDTNTSCYRPSRSKNGSFDIVVIQDVGYLKRHKFPNTLVWKDGQSFPSYKQIKSKTQGLISDEKVGFYGLEQAKRLCEFLNKDKAINATLTPKTNWRVPTTKDADELITSSLLADEKLNPMLEGLQIDTPDLHYNFKTQIGYKRKEPGDYAPVTCISDNK